MQARILYPSRFLCVAKALGMNPVRIVSHGMMSLCVVFSHVCFCHGYGEKAARAYLFAGMVHTKHI